MSVSQETKLHYEEILVTPQIAKYYLTKNKVNRNLSNAVVARYARDMSAGAWDMTGEPISFDTDGNLSNGQHRINAIIMADTAILMSVIHGVDLGANIDSGNARTNTNRYQIKYGDSTYTSNVNADMNVLSLVIYGRSKSTLLELYKMYSYFRSAVEDIYIIPNISNDSSVYRAACIIGISEYEMSLQTIERFLYVIRSGFVKGEYENQAVALRQYATRLSTRIHRGGAQRTSLFKQSLLSSLISFSKGRVSEKICRLIDFDWEPVKKKIENNIV